jgi:hypothetical protein
MLHTRTIHETNEWTNALPRRWSQFAPALLATVFPFPTLYSSTKLRHRHYCTIHLYPLHVRHAHLNWRCCNTVQISERQSCTPLMEVSTRKVDERILKSPSGLSAWTWKERRGSRIKTLFVMHISVWHATSQLAELLYDMVWPKSTLRIECVNLEPVLHGALVLNFFEINILKFQKNLKKNLRCR